MYIYSRLEDSVYCNNVLNSIRSERSCTTETAVQNKASVSFDIRTQVLVDGRCINRNTRHNPLY